MLTTLNSLEIIRPIKEREKSILFGNIELIFLKKQLKIFLPLMCWQITLPLHTIF